MESLKNKDNTKQRVAQAFADALAQNLTQILATEKTLKEGAEAEQEISSDALMSKREEMMDEVALHDEIAADSKDHQLALAGLDATLASTQVEFGALVYTNAHAFLICAPMRALVLDGTSYVGASIQSPLVKALWGKKVGYSTVVNGKQVRIEQIL